MTNVKEYKVLLVDDDQYVLEGLELLLEDVYQTAKAASGQQAIDIVQVDDQIAVVVMDIKMPGMDGITAARKIRELAPDIPVIFHTGFPGQYSEDEIDTSEKPYDYVQKGESVTKLNRAIRNAMDSFLTKENSVQLSNHAEFAYGIVGKSSLMMEVYRIIQKVASSDIKVMILGETGTGKELVAKAIHNHSSRQDKRLVIFNCNHKAPDLVESELFGHGKGAFTGAVADRIGLFEYADGGTVFLDEIGDLDITTQAKLLRVLETGEFQTVGETPQPKKTDVRLLCATHHNLEKLVKNGKFREDLFYRLKGIVISMPPLRERKEDIPLLVSKFSDKLTIEQNRLPVYFDKSAIHVFLNQDWPGNVRQLQDTVESIITLSNSDIIIGSDVEDYLDQHYLSQPDNTNGTGLAAKTKDFRRNCIIEALHETGNNVNATARLLEVDPANLRKWIKNYDIPLT